MIRRLYNPMNFSALALWVVALITVGISFETMVVRSASQQQSSWKETVARVYTAMSKGQEDEAWNLIQPLLAEEEKHAEIAQLCLELGEVLRGQGNRDATESLLQKALEIRTALYGSETLPVGEVSFLLGRLHLSKALTLQVAGSRGEAKEYLDRAEVLLNMALRIRERLSAPRAVGVGEILQQLTMLCLQRHGFNEKACPENSERRKRIAEIATGNLSPRDPNWANALYALADVHEKRGEHEQSLILKLTVLEQMKESFGESDDSVAQALRLIAETYRNMDLWPQAVSALEEVVTIGLRREQNTLAFAFDLKNLAGGYINANQLNRARATFLRAMDIEKKQLGPDSYARTVLLKDYAAFLEKNGSVDEANVVKAEIQQIATKTIETYVRPLSEAQVKTIREAKRKLGVALFEEGIPTQEGFSIRCLGQRVERIEPGEKSVVLHEAGDIILSCDVDDETNIILVATSAKVIAISPTGKLLEDSNDEPGTISSAVWAGTGTKIISHDYSRYDTDDELVLIKDGKFVMVLGRVPSHSVLVGDGGRILAVAPPDSMNISRVFEVILPR